MDKYNEWTHRGPKVILRKINDMTQFSYPGDSIAEVRINYYLQSYYCFRDYEIKYGIKFIKNKLNQWDLLSQKSGIPISNFSDYQIFKGLLELFIKELKRRRQVRKSGGKIKKNA